MLDNDVDLSNFMTVKDYVITVTAKEALPAGIRQFTMVATFNGNPATAGSVSACLEQVVNTLRTVQGASKDSLTKCTVTIRNPVKDAISIQQEQQVSSSKAPSVIAERHAQRLYPPFLSESAIASITSKVPSLQVDALSPEVAEAVTLDS
jgi:hypothetical protein